MRQFATTDADADADGRDIDRARECERSVRVTSIFRASDVLRGFFRDVKPNGGDDDDAELRAPGGACRRCEDEDDARTTIVDATTGETRDEDGEDRRDVCGVGRGRRSARTDESVRADDARTRGLDGAADVEEPGRRVEFHHAELV